MREILFNIKRLFCKHKIKYPRFAICKDCGQKINRNDIAEREYTIGGVSEYRCWNCVKIDDIIFNIIEEVNRKYGILDCGMPSVNVQEYEKYKEYFKNLINK